METEENLSKPDTVMPKESLRVQEAEWVEKQIEKQRQIEDELREKLRQEQEILDEKKRSIEENMERNRELRRYNEVRVEELNAQVYELHGVSEDRLKGLKEYSNGCYKGCALTLFLLSAALFGLCGYLHGFDSKICLFMLAFSGIEGALLTQEGKRSRFMKAVCRFLYVLLFPAMAVIFVCYEMEFAVYRFLMPVFVLAGAAILVIGTAGYFIYNPYRKDKKQMRAARVSLKEIEQIAKKAVKRNQKLRMKEEAMLARQKKKADALAAKQQLKAERRQARRTLKEEKKEIKNKKREASRLARRARRNEIGGWWKNRMTRITRYFRGWKRKEPEIIPVVQAAEVQEAIPEMPEKEALKIPEQEPVVMPENNPAAEEISQSF